MSQNFEFDDNDDVLLNAFCTPPPSENTSPQKRLKEENDENIPVKRPKSNENMSPIIQFSHILSNNTSSPLKNNSIPNAAKRIFPGPAGILLDENQTDICTQDISSFFQDGPWKEMSKDFKISSSLFLFDKFNIAWIKKEASANKFVSQKVPFLTGILLSLEVSERNTQKYINITLRDMTGTIQGTVLQNLYEEYAGHFTLGSVMVLIQFGVLSCTCDKCCDNHYLTITPKNLAAFYSGKEKMIMKKVNSEEILKDYCNRNKKLELVGTHKILNSPNNVSNSIVSNTNSIRCTFSKNRNMGVQSPSINILSSNLVNRTVNNSKNILQSTSEIFSLPKVRTIDKTISETAVLKGVCDSKTSADINLNRSPATSTRLFTFKKVNTSPKSNVYKSSTVTIDESSSSSRNDTLSSEQVDNNKTKKDIGIRNVDSVKIGKSQLSVKVDKVEHEKIWKDLLEDVDVNSLFNDEF